MAHDATKVLLGSTESGVRVVDDHAGAVDAGKFVVLTSANALSNTLSAGSLIGVSLGADLSDISRSAVCRKGLKVPVLIGDGFTPDIGAQVQVHATDGTAVASGTAVNAVYASSTLTGVKEDGTTHNVALIDMQGGL